MEAVMKRLISVVCVVLVLGAWSCQAPTTSTGSGGDPVAGMSTTGLAGLVGGEDWHYVGEAGEPAFENGWANVGSSNKLAFRIREAGIVDLQGFVTGGTGRVFTLPADYTPNTGSLTFFAAQGFTSPNFIAIRITVDNNGYVSYGGPAGVTTLYIAGQFFLDPPT